MNTEKPEAKITYGSLDYQAVRLQPETDEWAIYRQRGHDWVQIGFILKPDGQQSNYVAFPLNGASIPTEADFPTLEEAVRYAAKGYPRYLPGVGDHRSENWR